MKIEVIPYEPEHAFLILERNVRDADLYLTSLPDFEKWCIAWKQNGPAYTQIIEREIVMCAGVVLLDWRRGEAWTLLSSLFYLYKKTCFKTIREYLSHIIGQYQLRRVQTLIRPDMLPNQRFVEHLGFEKEGLLRMYGPNGEDFIMYGRVNGCHH
jgi:RimJ/RimL family protein N-acetyltransferase